LGDKSWCSMEVLIFITVFDKKIKEVLNNIRKLEGIVEAHSLTGKYDIYAKISVKDEKRLFETVTEQIRFIEGVLSTETCIIAD
jgi:DNA-binding Lrp family transcriptional regulator